MKKIFYLLLFCSFSFGQQLETVNFINATVQIQVYPNKQKIKGTVNYTFNILKKTDSIFLDSKKGVRPIFVSINNKKITYTIKDNKLWLLKTFLPSKKNVLHVLYEATPKKALYFIPGYDKKHTQVWTQGQGKHTSNWLPSIDDVNDKIEFDLTILAPKNNVVIANGKLIGKEIVADNFIKWQYNMEQPMSSYLVAFVIGEYDKKVVKSKSGVPLEMYYYPKKETNFENTYKNTTKIFNFLESEIGIPYPWQNYKQIPVKDFLYAGMENTGTTIFSDIFLVDDIAFNDQNYIGVNAHELAHQWFGNLVTATSSKHHWLQEGFATYYALLVEKKLFGDEYYYYKLYQSAKQLKDVKNTKLLNPKASSLVFYQKGAWALHVLKEKIGEKAFKKSVQQYLKKNQFKTVNTSDFMNVVNKNTEKNLLTFENIWLHSEIFPYATAKLALQKNKTLKKILQKPVKYCKKNNVYLQIETLKNIASSTKINIDDKIKTYKKAFKTEDLKVRQTLSEIIDEIPLKLQSNFESLLNDKSYKTIENALFKLWIQFPEKRKQYLDKTKQINGFNDKNIRTLWLTLALLTENYKKKLMSNHLNELISYTAEKHHFEVRKNAFNSLKIIKFTNTEILKNLEKATHHHNWRFKKFAISLQKEIQ